MDHFGCSMLWFWTAYIVVTIIGVAHTVFNGVVLKYKFMDGTETCMKDIEAYEKTMRWHPLYNVVVFSIFSVIYLSSFQSVTFHDVISTCIIWTSITIVFDLVGWVLIKHPWACTFKDFYVDYQPWISLIYIAIFISPIIAWFILR